MPQPSQESLRALAQVSDTGLLTLFGRALESRRGGVFHDPEAEALSAALHPLLATSDRPLHRRLAAGRLNPKHGIYMGLRARHFDDRCLDFVARRPGGVIVNMGCGLDTRFHRLRLAAGAPANLEVVDVDLPAMIAVKSQVLPPEPGYRLLAADVGEPSWLVNLPLDRPLLFLAEGLLMYLDPAVVRALVLALHARARGCELVAEIIRLRWLSGWRGKIVERKLQRSFSIDGSVGFRFGLEDARDLETWAEGIETLGEWSLFDDRSPRLRGLNWMGRFDGLRRLQWVAHWRLG